MRKYNGAISLFMVIILLSSFIFGGVFIDASRIYVAKSKVRNAANSALRSSMSYYSKPLVSEYGLYGAKESEADENFKKYFELNMKIKDEHLKMFDYNIVDAKVTAAVPITDSEEFEKQVMEYSKYRAPVTTTMMLVEKVKDVFANFKKASDKISDSTDALEEFKEQFKTDGKQISLGLKSAKDNAANQIKGIAEGYKNKLKDDKDYVKDVKSKIQDQFKSIEEEFKNSSNTLDKMVKDTETYRQSAKADVDSINSEAIATKEQIESTDNVGSYPTEEGETDVAKQADNQAAEKGSLRTGVESLKGDIEKAKENVMKWTDELATATANWTAAKTTLETLKTAESGKKTEYDEKSSVFTSALSKYTNAKNAQTNYNTALQNKQNSETEMNSAIEALNNDAAAMAAVNLYRDPTRSPDYDSRNSEQSKASIRAELKRSHSDLSGVFGKIDEFLKCEKTLNDTPQGGDDVNLKAAYDSASKEKDTAEKEYNAAKEAREAQEKTVEKYETEIDTITGNISKEMQDIINKTVPDVKDLDVIDMAKDKIVSELKKVDIIDTVSKIKDALGGKMEKYQDSTGANGGDDVESSLSDGIIAKIKSLTKYAKDFFGTFTDAEKLRNNAYMVDYIMDKCTYLTSQTSRNHYFEKGEVEYIIFGNEEQWLNIVACIGTITMMRFVINFVDYFITGPGDLIGKAVYGLGRGAAKTCLDLRTMFISDISTGVGLCPSFSHLKLTYSDHLRLMLFFKFDQMQEKMKDTIYTNMKKTLKGGELNELNTEMTANVQVEVNMLILPMFFGVFTGEHFNNGNYVIKDSITMHY